MFGLFKKTPEKEKLEKQYKKLLDEAYKLSHTNRQASDAKMVEAEAIGKRLSELNSLTGSNKE